MIQTSALEIAGRFVGLQEVSGVVDNPQVMAMLRLDNAWPEHDEVPWCSAFVNYVCWLLSLPRSRSLRARSWLRVGTPIDLRDAEPDADIVILWRGDAPQPGPDVLDAPGHVGFFSALENGHVHILGGNQSNRVSIRSYPTDRVLGVRRLT